MTERTKPHENEWVTPGEASAALGITTMQLTRLADKGVIRAIRPGGSHRRYAASDIEAIIAGEPWDQA
ncbi:MAG TPA: helix-turn-helix domain-containing protein [Terrimesophilobacter sp.]|nr:helix-turn-helix domain-containing protein [Terrimesophilobacter sp.]